MHPLTHPNANTLVTAFYGPIAAIATPGMGRARYAKRHARQGSISEVATAAAGAMKYVTNVNAIVGGWVGGWVGVQLRYSPLGAFGILAPGAIGILAYLCVNAAE